MKGKYTDEFIASREFLNTYEWRKVRMEALVKHGNKCMCCNRTPEGEYYTCVDHIKPRKTHTLILHLTLTTSRYFAMYAITEKETGIVPIGERVTNLFLLLQKSG